MPFPKRPGELFMASVMRKGTFGHIQKVQTQTSRRVSDAASGQDFLRSKSEKGTATTKPPTITAQLYDRLKTQTTLGFAAALSQYGVSVIKRAAVADIARDQPVLVMCQNYSRIAADILHATEELTGIRDAMVAVIIIHAKAKHSLPSMMTAEYIEDPACKKFGLLVDFGFMDGTLYDCDMNKQGQTKLTSFLKEHSVQRGGSQQPESKQRRMNGSTSKLGKPMKSQSFEQDHSCLHVTGYEVIQPGTVPSMGYVAPFQRTVQLFDSVETSTSIDFSRMMEKKLQTEYSTRVVSTRPPDISPDKPVLVVCQNYSDLETDIKRATERLTDIPVEKVAVLIIHAKEKKSLPIMMTSYHLGEDASKKFGLLIDFGFLDKTLHDCDMNTQGEKKLKSFLNEYIDLQARGGIMPNDEELKKTHTVSGGSGCYPIQLYAEDVDALEAILKIPRDFQVVRSVVDLRKENLWIVVCKAGSVEEEQIQKATSINPKIMVTVDPDASDISGGWLNTSCLRISVGRNGFDIEYVKVIVMPFISAFVENDTKAIFENDKDMSARIEVFKTIKGETAAELSTFLTRLPCREVLSVTDFTKNDPRILWVIICEPGSTTMFEQASSMNAKVMLMFTDDVSTADVHREERHNLLILMLHPNSLSVIAEKLKEEIKQFMKTVQQRLWESRLEEFFNGVVPRRIIYREEKGSKCSIL